MRKYKLFFKKDWKIESIICNEKEAIEYAKSKYFIYLFNIWPTIWVKQ